MNLKYNFEIIDMDEHFIAVPIGNNAADFHGIIKLNTTGTKILRMVMAQKSEAEIISELSKEYDSSRDIITQYVSVFLSQLSEANIFE